MDQRPQKAADDIIYVVKLTNCARTCAEKESAVYIVPLHDKDAISKMISMDLRPQKAADDVIYGYHQAGELLKRELVKFGSAVKYIARTSAGVSLKVSRVLMDDPDNLRGGGGQEGIGHQQSNSKTT